MEDLNVVNDTQEGNVDLQNTGAETGESEAAADSATAAQKSAQTPEQNALAKQVRIAAQKEARDALIAEIYGDQGVYTYEQYVQAMQEQKAAQEASKLNISPEAYERISMTEKAAKEALTKLSQYERKELLEKQSDTLSNDAKWGKFYKENEAEIKGLAFKLNTDLDTAKLLVLEDKYQQTDVESVKKAAVEEYLSKLRDGYRPVEGSGATPASPQKEPKTFEEARKRSIAFLKENQQF